MANSEAAGMVNTQECEESLWAGGGCFGQSNHNHEIGTDCRDYTVSGDTLSCVWFMSDKLAESLYKT